jgi:hypothetical protein
MLVALLVSGLAAPALADPAADSTAGPAVTGTHGRQRPASAPARGDSDCGRARKAGRTCELTIEPEDVGGDRPVPDGTDLRARWFEPPGSLLRLRRDFVPEIVRATDDL